MSTSETKIYAVFGNPVAHSLSPLMHQAAMDHMGLKARYIPFCVGNIEKAVEGIRGLDIQGVSVTLPFKTEAMKYLDEVDENGLRIGAINTIRNNQGRLKGYNTDWLGFVLSLKETVEMRGKRIAVLGAGGAARAVIYGLIREGGLPIILNRTLSRGQALGEEFGCPFYSFSEKGKIEGDGLVNTTPVGMSPNREESPFPRGLLNRFSWVSDIIYNPLKTRLLREAEEAGCRTVSGLGMFIQQGAEQIKIWTGLEPPRNLMREVVEAVLKKNEND